MGANTYGATVVAADTEGMRRAAAWTDEASRRLLTGATTLGQRLDRLRNGDRWGLAGVRELDGHVGAWADRIGTEARELGALATAFELADRGGWRRWLGSAVGVALVASWRAPRARPVPHAEIAPDLAAIRAALDPGGWGIRGGDLDRIAETLRGRDGAHVDAIVAALTDDELARWFAAMDGPRWRGGWSPRQRDDLLQHLGERMHLDTWRRLSRFTDRLEPRTTGVVDDLARHDGSVDPMETWTATARGVLAARGPGDASAYAFDDVTQGRLGDCWLIGAMVALALRDPTSLGRLIRPNRNGTFTVRFPDGHREVVSPDLPFVDGGLRFAGYAGGGDGGTELWPLVLEKAVAQREGGWAAIEDDSASRGVELLSGRPGGWLAVEDVTVADLARRHAEGQILILATIPAPTATPDDPAARQRWVEHEAPPPFRWGTSTEHRLHPGHAFVVTDVDAGADAVSVINPWNPAWAPLVLSRDDLMPSISGVFVNAAHTERSPS